MAQLPAQQSPSVQSNANNPAASNPAATTSSGETSERTSWIARDPLTGRVFQQEVVSINVPTTQWEVKPVTTTVYEPRSVVKTVPSTQVIYTPSTQYVMQPKLRGWWNPLQQPVQAYEFVPVTTWQPQSQTVQQQVATIEWEPKQQVFYVPQAVQRMQTQQQIVSRELPTATATAVAGTLPTLPVALAGQPKPLFNLPILSQQRMLPWPASSPSYSYAATPTTSLRNAVSSGLRPIANSVAPDYSAPLQPTSAPASIATRDTFQTGMSPTILR